MTPDRITVSVIQHRLESIVQEMGEAMLRTAYSQILNSSRDFSTAVFDGRGRLAAQAERRGLTQFMHAKDGSFGFVGDRPAGLPARETRRDISAELERFDAQKRGSHPNRLGGVALAGGPAAVREYMDEYVATGANYFVCSFQWGDLSHEQAMRSIELFATEVMPRYAAAPAPHG